MRAGFAALAAGALLAAAAGAQTAPATPGAVPRGGAPAGQLNVGHPAAVAYDAQGNYYIASGNNRVYRVDTAGTMTTYAGTGVSGRGGDGGPAAAAQLDCPSSLAIDSSGNLFIAEGCSGLIRRVDGATKTITTYAGNAPTGVTGGANGSSNASALPQLGCPDGVAVDGGGNLYVADNCNRKVWRIEAGTKNITNYAGTGDQGYSGAGGPASKAQISCPYGVATDGAGNVYIADGCDNVVWRVDAGTQIISVYAGTSAYGRLGDGGLATAAQMGCPFAVAFDGGGNLFVAEDCSRVVRRVDAATKIITAYAGNGQTGGAGDNGPATSAQLGCPYGVAADRAGNLLIADQCNGEVRRVDAATKVITTVASGE